VGGVEPSSAGGVARASAKKRGVLAHMHNMHMHMLHMHMHMHMHMRVSVCVVLCVMHAMRMSR